MKIALSQINPTVGDLDGNARIIRDIIKSFSPICDLIVFPEMALTGYPPQDLLLDSAFIQQTSKTLNSIARSVKTVPVIIGTVRKENNHLFNTAAILQDGDIIDYRDKTHLPTYDVFDEDRYFTSAQSINPAEININGKKVLIGVQICEDLWDAEHDIKVSQELSDKGAKFLINISASPYHVNKLDERLDNMASCAIHLNKYFIYCNLVGSQDELVFDGQSCIVNPFGKVVTLLQPFKEDIKIIDLDHTQPVDVLNFKEEEQIYYALSLGLQDYFKKTGYTKAVLGLSGGIDSSLTAAIAQNALGSNNVLGIAMPSIYSSDHSITDAKHLAENLGIDFLIIPINSINKQMLDGLSLIMNGSETGFAEENLQARIRGNILMTTANKKGALLLNTGNKTETALGYCTMYGDMAGALAVISDLNKSQVYAVSRWINENNRREIIPENSISKPPSAELRPDQVDPFDYDVVSPHVDNLITEPNRVYELEDERYPPELIQELKNKIRLAEYKRRQAPPGIRISSKAFGVGRRYPIVNKFEV